jgi:DNA-binding winged helix-turn-helix (wHTH) protein
MKAMNRYQPAESIGFTFGSFELVPTRRLLSKEGRVLKIGSRALDLLIALIERAGQIVTKEELMSQVWNDLIVEDANLRVHVYVLRRLLGDDGINSRYIVHVARRGYVFVAPLVTRTSTLIRQDSARSVSPRTDSFLRPRAQGEHEPKYSVEA